VCLFRGLTWGSGPHPSSFDPTASRFHPNLSDRADKTPPPRRRRAGAGVTAAAVHAKVTAITHMERIQKFWWRVCPCKGNYMRKNITEGVFLKQLMFSHQLPKLPVVKKLTHMYRSVLSRNQVNKEVGEVVKVKHWFPETSFFFLLRE
jgi:hypothetical protein